MKRYAVNAAKLFLILTVLASSACGLGTSAYKDAILDGASNLNRGRTDQALADFNRAIQLDPQQAGGYVGRGNTFNILGRYEEAVADYNTAIGIDPTQAEAYANRAIAYDRLKEYEKAIADYEKCLALNPKIDNPPGFIKRLFSNEPNQERGIRKRLEALKTQVEKKS
jgi:tetratricopeptide (TPR) repeat protein